MIPAVGDVIDAHPSTCEHGYWAAMGPEIHSFSKTTGLTRKCSYCQKMVFFSKSRCKQCRYRCHKKCSSQNVRNTCHRTYSGEEHWTKVLQANEVMGGAGGRGRPHPHPQTGVLAAMYVRFWRWVGAAGRRDLTVGPAAAVAAAGVTAGRSSSLPCGAPHHRCAPHHPACRRHASVSSPDDGPGADLSVSSRSLSAATERQHWWRDTLTRTCSTDSCRCGAPPSPCRQRDGRWQHASVASTISCPPVTRRTSPLASPLTTSPSPLATSLSLTGCEPTTTAASNKERMCSTWPPQGGATYRNGADEDREPVVTDDTDNDESVFGDFEDEAPLRTDQEVYLRASLGECSIPYTDLMFDECIRVGRRHECHKGRWHGEVMIHTYTDLSATELPRFLAEMCKLSMLRHENIALFMGACIDSPRLAVVTSVIKGASLYEHLHVRADAMAMRMRVNVARQVAQGMGYLHAKGVVVRKLNSKNIFLDPKVKLCLTDYGMAEKRHDRYDYGSMPSGHLTYIAPEVMRTLAVVSPRLESTKPCSNATNVYAFGTILYELVTGRFPFRHAAPQSVIWQVASGRPLPQTSHIKCSTTLKCLIDKCWSHREDDRPTFAVIAQELQVNAALHKRHSSSQPERINYIGLSAKPVFGH